MGDQHALPGGIGQGDVGLDQVAAAAHVGRHVGGQVAHAGLQHGTVARALYPVGVVGKAGGIAVVQRQHLAALGLLPPGVDQCPRPFGLGGGQVVALGKVGCQGVQLPDVGIERLAGWVVGHRLPAALPEPAVAEHLENLQPLAHRRTGLAQVGGKTLAVQRQQRGQQVGGMVETVAQLTVRSQAFRPG